MTARKDIASSVVVLLFGIVFLVYSSRYPLDSWASPGPGAFPMMAGGMVVLLGSWQLLHSIWKWKHPGPSNAAAREDEPGISSLRGTPGGKAAISLIAAFVLYILGIKWVGYFVSTFLFGIYVSRLSETRDLWKPVLLSAGIGLFCYLVFVGWLKLSFPSGILF
jgi:hypothetical protein